MKSLQKNRNTRKEKGFDFIGYFIPCWTSAILCYEHFNNSLMKTMDLNTIERILLMKPISPDERNEISADSEYEPEAEYSDSVNDEL